MANIDNTKDIELDTSMLITLEFSEKEFKATAAITLDTSHNEGQFSFWINNELNISKITVNDKPVNYIISERNQPPFRPLVKKIDITNEEAIRRLTINYMGSVAYSLENRSCWHNIITDDIKSLSWYSAWFPQDTSVEIIHDKVIVVSGDDYFIVKGCFDEVRNIWEYGGNGNDPFNIVAYRKSVLKVVSDRHMNIYFIDERIKEYAAEALSSYMNVLNFYNGNLFKKKEIPVLDVACASPAITTGGGYRRKDFMWCTTPGGSAEEIAWLSAHETAHIWCCGADSYTWEDWLNEATADWAALLFALDSRNSSLFNFILNPKLERYSSLPPIKTVDGSRPDGVHEKGTVLFYKMYKKLGIEAVSKVIRLFTDLDIKTTSSLLDSLYTNNDNEIADFIQKGIVD